MFVKIWPQNYNIFFVSPNFFAKKCTFFHIFVHFFKNLCKFVQKIAPKLQNLSQQVAKSLRARDDRPQLYRYAHKVGPAGGQRRPAQDRRPREAARHSPARNAAGHPRCLLLVLLAVGWWRPPLVCFAWCRHRTAAQGTWRRNLLRDGFTF